MDILSRQISSFVYGGGLVSLVPSEMRRTGDQFSMSLPDGFTATLEFEFIGDNAFSILLRLKNNGIIDSLPVTVPKSIDMSFPVAKQALPFFNSLSGDSCGGESFLPISIPITPGSSIHREPMGGRSSNTTAFPYFDIAAGTFALIGAIGWSGQWTADISAFPGLVNLQIGLADAAFYLHPGEEVRLPSALLMLGTETRKLRRDFRRLQREHFSPKTYLGEQMKLPLAIQPFDRYFYGQCPDWPTTAGQIRTVESAAKCQHFDTDWLDAAWFKNGFPDGVGNYSFAEGFPDGLKAVSEAAHSCGMKFMLWFEPERIHFSSETFRDHPEMVLKADLTGADFETCEKNSGLFNLGDDHARQWLTETMIRFIRDNGIDIYRNDFNINPLPFWREHDEEGRRGITEIRYITGLYKYWDAVIAAFPGILIDNCASGGRRIDFETCKRSVPLWRSDTGCRPETENWRTQTWNQNQNLCLMRYLAYESCAVWVTKAYDVRAAQSMGLACTFDVLNPDFDFDAAKAILAEFCRLRPFWDGDFFALTEPTPAEDGWCGYGFTLGGSGIAYLFRREQCSASSEIFALPADPNKLYRLAVTDENLQQTERVLSGHELSAGVCFTISEPRSSLLVEFHEVS